VSTPTVNAVAVRFSNWFSAANYVARRIGAGGKGGASKNNPTNIIDVRARLAYCPCRSKRQ
jgi:hypothetical protein